MYYISKYLSEMESVMPDQKIDNLLNLAMDATPQERAKSENLNVGYDSSAKIMGCDREVQWSGEQTWR